MATKPLSLADAISAEAKAGTLGLSIQIGWAREPLDWASQKFESLWTWLEEHSAADWDRVAAAAEHFHPDYIVDQKTRAALPNPPGGSIVYLQMERWEYSPEVLKVVAPTVAGWMPKRNRGKGGPTEYLIATMHVAAMLAAHEYAQLEGALGQKPCNGEQVARHLYFFERFTALWTRARLSRPPSATLNADKQREAAAWKEALLSFHREREQDNSGRRVSARESAIAWAATRATPSAEVAERALGRMLKAAAT